MVSDTQGSFPEWAVRMQRGEKGTEGPKLSAVADKLFQIKELEAP